MEEAIDRNRLSQAVQETSFCFTKSGMLCGENPLNSITVEELGDIKIPVSLKDALRIKDISAKFGNQSYIPENLSTVQQPWEIDSSKILFTTQREKLDLSSLIVRHLELPTNMIDIQAKLFKLILYGRGTHHKCDDLKFDDNEFGSFGIAILHLPVEGGHGGGCLKVEYKNKREIIDQRQNVDQRFFLAAYYGNCKHSVEPVTRGWMLTLVFNLVWTNASTLPTYDFPTFLTALKKTEEALIPWIPRREVNFLDKKGCATEDYVSNLTKKETYDVCLDIWECFAKKEESDYYKDVCSCCRSHDCPISDCEEYSADDFSDDDQQCHHCGSSDCFAGCGESDYSSDSDQDEHSEPSWNSCNNDSQYYSTDQTCKENILFFVLQEKYDKNDFGFNRLKGKDKNLAHLFQSCSLLDIHLAMVTLKKTSKRPNCDCEVDEDLDSSCAAKTTHWIDTNGINKNLAVQLHWEKQCVPFGSCRNLSERWQYQKPDKKITTEKDQITIRNKYMYNFIMVLWPKTQSIQINCRYGFRSLLELMENSLALSASRMQEKLTRQKFIQDLKEIISFCCCAEPKRVWCNPAMKKGEVTLRLLRICIALRASDEGLVLLKTLGLDIDFGTTSANSNMKAFEGIQTQEVAQTIVEFQRQVTGWNDSAHWIQKMISPNRLAKQMAVITKLPQFLLETNNIEGAKLVGDWISASLANIDFTAAAKLTHSDVDAYLDMAVSLEAKLDTSNRERLTLFKSFFPKLEPSLQCRIVLDLESQGRSRFKGLQSCEFVFQDLCSTLPAVLNTCAPSVTFVLLESLVVFYTRLRNAEWLQALLSNICRVSEIITKDVAMQKYTSRGDLLKKLLLSPIIWKCAISSDLGKLTMTLLLDHHSTILVRKLAILAEEQVLPNKNGIVPHSYPLPFEKLLSSLISCIRFLMRMERNPKLADPKRISMISPKLPQLSLQQLYILFIAVHEKSFDNFDKHPSYRSTILHLCDSVISQIKTQIAFRPTTGLIVNTLRGFLTLRNESLARELLVEICTREVNGAWNQGAKYEMFLVLCSPTVWGELDDFSKLQVLNSCTTLIQSWINTICQNGSYILPPQENDNFNQQITYCIRLFFLTEKSRFDASQIDAAHMFESLFQKLTPLRLIWVLDFVSNSPQLGELANYNIKNYPVLVDWYRKACMMFLRSDIVSLFSSEMAIKIVKCMLWLGEDRQLWQTFAAKICASFSKEKSNPFVREVSKNVQIQQIIVDSPTAFSAFLTIADYWAEKLKFLIEPPFTWCMPEAAVPRHPEVEAFLRSSEFCFVYRKFASITEACHFAKELEEQGPLNGFSVAVNVSGANAEVGPFRCTIGKTHNYHRCRVMHPFQILKSEFEELLKVRDNLVTQERAQKRFKHETVSHSNTQC